MNSPFGKRGTIGTNEIVGIAIALLMVAIVIPIGLNEIGAATAGDNAENWGSSKDVLVVLIATVVPILAILGIAMKFM